MNRLIRVSLLTVALASPLVLQAQEAPRSQRGSHAMHVEGARVSPAARLLAHRAELGLSAEQVARLQEIEARLQEETRPLVERLRAARPEHPDDPRDLSREQRRALRESMRETMREHRPLIEELRETRREVMQEAREVLTSEQQQKARELVRARRDGFRRHHLRGERGRRGEHGPHGPRVR